MTTKKMNRLRDPRHSNKEVLHVVITGRQFEKICHKSLRNLATPRNVELQYLPTSTSELTLAESPGLLITRLADISTDVLKRAHVSSTTRQLFFLEGLPVESIAARLLPLNIRNPNRIHLATQRDPKLVENLISRLFRGLTERGEQESIVDAWVENHQLVLLSPTFSRLFIPLEKLTKFLGPVNSEYLSFEIDEDGRFLYWPHADVHMGWEQLASLIDPARLLLAQEKTEQYQQRYGQAIRILREEAGLTQSEIHGVSERQLRRVEHGQGMASRGILEALAKAHSIPLNDYVELLAQRVKSISRSG